MEFLKLTGSQARLVEPSINWPLDALVIYAIEDEKIIGKIAIMVLPHIEDIYVSEEYKSSLLAIKLFEEAENTLKALNRTCAASFIMDNTPDMVDYAKRVGYKKFPATVWIKPLVEE